MINENIGGMAILEDTEDDDGRKKEMNEARKNALYYGWEYFKYHAQQRQAVFRFYLILVGVALAGLVASYSEQYKGLADHRWFFGVSLFILSLMFWRLDIRSYQLVKVAEGYLRVEEEKLASDVGTQTVRLIHEADTQKSMIWRFFRLATFRQVYGWIFLLVALVGLYLTLQPLGWFDRACIFVARKIAGYCG